MVMLISVFRAIVNKLNYESFDTISMENIKKKLSKKLITLSFFHKMFLKIVSKPMPLGHLLIFLKKKKKKNHLS